MAGVDAEGVAVGLFNARRIAEVAVEESESHVGTGAVGERIERLPVFGECVFKGLGVRAGAEFRVAGGEQSGGFDPHRSDGIAEQAGGNLQARRLRDRFESGEGGTTDHRIRI